MTARDDALKLLSRLIGDGERDGADAEVTAIACLSALMASDWHYMGTSATAWPLRNGGSGLPTNPEVAASLRDLHAELEAKAEASRHRGAVPGDAA